MVLLQDSPNPDYERTFTFTFSTGQSQLKSTLRVKLNISEPQNIEELASRVVGHHGIPCFVEEKLKDALKNFVDLEKLKLSNESTGNLIKKFRQKPDNLQKIAKNIAFKYNRTWAGFINLPGSEEAEDFSTMYHKLIHSKTMYILLSLEENYYHSVQKIISDQENSMMKLRERQELEMQRACEHVNSSLYTEADVNNLATKQAADTERLLGEWRTKYSKMVQNQRKEYRDVVARLYAEMMANNGEVDEHGHTYIEVKKILDLSSKSSDMYTITSNTDTNSTHQYESQSTKKSQKGTKMASSSNSLSEVDVELSRNENFNTPRLEESFTINLGAQMKTMHNIRLVAAPILHYCRHSNQSGDVQAQRLQTILSLYSNSLSGLVLLTDNSIDSTSGLKSEFTSICEESTEFHFPSYKEQLDEIKRRKSSATSVDQLSIKSDDALSTDSSSSSSSENKSGIFQDGDFYVTKHSNLSKVHIVFHLAANIINLRSSESSATVSSRHPAILGLRHILKVAASHDVGTLSLPILLCHELTDRTDEAWIVKRAELVMKCMKGFMMEMAAWDGGISRTMQFVVPPDISDSTFYRLSTMLPEIFRTTSARNLTDAKVSSPPSPRPSRR